MTAEIKLSLSPSGELILECPPITDGKLTAPLVIPSDASGMAAIMRTLRGLRTNGRARYGESDSSPSQSMIDQWIRSNRVTHIDKARVDESPEEFGL